MKKFGAKRVPRQVGQHDEDAAEDVAGPTIQRPNFKPRKSTNLRTSVLADDDEAAEAASVVKPKRSNASKLATQRDASKRIINLPTRRDDDDEEDSRPSYSATSLQELKNSTPSTPADFSASDADDAALQDVSQGTRDLDLSSKFGTSLSRYQANAASSAIPSAGEIAEKKARRARLAQEQKADEYISLDPDDPNLNNYNSDDDENVERDASGRLVLKEKDKWGEMESRLVRDDEDIMENFEDFTEDGNVHLGRNAEREAALKRRKDMAAQIEQAEASDSDTSSNESEKERNAAFEAAQTRHGTSGASATPNDPYEHMRPKTPPIITPLPTLDGVLARLRKQVSEMQTCQMKRRQEMEALQREKVRLAEEEVRIQRALRETAEKFAELRREKGIVQNAKPAIEAPAGLLMAPEQIEAEKVVDDEENADGDGGDGDGEDEDVNEEDANGGGHSGLGFAGLGSMAGMGGSGTGLGMARRPDPEDDW